MGLLDFCIALQLFISGNTEDIEKFSRRLVKVTREHGQEAQKLLGLMGIPHLTAPCEAEAQCAELAKGGKVGAWISIL